MRRFARTRLSSTPQPEAQTMTDRETWTAVDQYFDDLLLPPDDALEAALKASEAAGLPQIQVAPSQGKLLHLLALTLGAKTILEIGTLGGYSTIWLARAVPAGGKVITLEADARHATVARSNFARAGLENAIELRLGKAIDTLPQLAHEGRGPFDLVFIDADKPSTADYFEWAMKLTRPGSLIIVDNVVRKGGVVDANNPDQNVQGIRRFVAALAAEKRITATWVQTVGVKGYDGLCIGRVNS
jgi:predicted O-methyltransferase YrrM